MPIHPSLSIHFAGQGNSSTPSNASIVGFAVVLSFLIIALCIVVLLCVCFGKCRLPCKPTRVHEVEISRSDQDPRRRSNRGHLVPQPSPKNYRLRPSSLDNTTSVHPDSDREQRYASLPPSNVLSTSVALATLTSPPRYLFTPGTQNPQQLMEAVNTLPTSSSNNKVVHLSQINAESFKKITNSSKEYSQQQRSASLNTRTASGHQQRDSDQEKISISNRIVRPPDIPECGLPYQPQKSPLTPRGYHSTNRSAHSFPQRSVSSNPRPGPIPYLSNAPAARVESPLQDTTDEISSSINDQGHYAFPRPQEHQDQRTVRGSSKVSSTKTPPPSYSTVV